MAKIVGSINLHVLQSRLNRSNVYHQETLDEIDTKLLEEKQRRLCRKPRRTNNVGSALSKAFLEKSITMRGGSV